MKKEPSQIDIEIGNRIRKMRADLDVPAMEIARRLGVTRGAVGNWELGKGIKRENLQKIATKFKISLDWLATGRGSMEERPELSLPDRLKQKLADMEVDDVEEAFDNLEALVDKKLEKLANR